MADKAMVYFLPPNMSEIETFFKKSGKMIIPFTVKEIPDEQIACKLA